MELTREQIINQTMDDFYNTVKCLDPVEAPDRLERLAAQKDISISITAFARLVTLLNTRLRFAEKRAGQC